MYIMVRTQIYLPENLLDQLKKQALKQKTTTSELIRQAVDDMLSPKREKNLKYSEGITYKKTQNPLLTIAEAGEKYIPEDDGIHDLSSNIDKYLYGKD